MKSLKVEKFKSLSLAALLIASVTFVACSSDDEGIEQPTNGKYTMTIQASKSSDTTTRALEIGRNSTNTKNVLNAYWGASDVVKVINKSTETLLGGSLTAKTTGSATATLQGEITGSVATGNILYLVFPNTNFSFEGQDGTLSKIASTYDYSYGVATVTSVSGNDITATGSGEGGVVNFTNMQAIVRFTLQDQSGNAINPTSLNIKATQTVSGTAVNTLVTSLNLSGESPTPTTGELTITCAQDEGQDANVVYAALCGVDGSDVTLTATVGDNIYTYTKTGVTFTNGQYYEITVKMRPSTPLTMEAITAGTIKVEYPQTGMKYSLNGGDKTTMTETTTIDVAKGDKVQFYGDGTSINQYYYSWSYTNIAGGSAEVKVYGNIMSLVDETGYASNTTLTGVYAFKQLFKENTTLTDASGLLLPATTLTMACYDGMFSGCSSLITAPALPATTLTAACYSNMFSDCSSLTTAPALPATTLASSCYNYMFGNCTSLTTAPVLPAKTLANYCYNCMFSGCSSLNSVTCLATDNNAYEPTSYWLDGVASSGTFTKAKNVSWVTASHGIPYGWTVVEAE